jgi:YD repeat-containing protein
VVTQTDADNHTTTSVYDAVGNRTVLVDPDGNRTTSVYDALNRVTSETDPLNHAATSAFDALGRLTSATDRLGRRIDYAFDALSHTLTEKWYAAGGALVQTNTFSYDADGNQLTADPGGASYSAATSVPPAEEKVSFPTSTTRPP